MLSNLVVQYISWLKIWINQLVLIFGHWFFFKRYFWWIISKDISAFNFFPFLDSFSSQDSCLMPKNTYDWCSERNDLLIWLFDNQVRWRKETRRNLFFLQKLMFFRHGNYLLLLLSYFSKFWYYFAYYLFQATLKLWAIPACNFFSSHLVSRFLLYSFSPFFSWPLAQQPEVYELYYRKWFTALVAIGSSKKLFQSYYRKCLSCRLSCCREVSITDHLVLIPMHLYVARIRELVIVTLLFCFLFIPLLMWFDLFR